MSKTVLAQVDGFTPVIDAVVLDVGIISATVFGKAWRYCQMSDGVCKASQERIADELGISRITVNTHFAKLVEAGYLKDTTPTLLGLPHVYVDTGKAGLSIIFTAGGVNNINTGSKESLQGGVNNINTKIVVKKEKKVKEGASAEPKPETPFEVSLYRTVTKKFPPSPNYEDVIEKIQAVGVRLGRAVTADDLRSYYKAWTGRGWNQFSINWLDYAVKGELPTAQNNQNYNNNVSILQAFAQKG